MGRNGPEHRPGSETPRPLLRSGRRAGRKSVTLRPPLPGAFLTGAPSPQPLLLREAEAGLDAPAATPPSGRCGAGPAGELEGGKEVGLEEESAAQGRDLSGRSGGPCVVTSRRVYILGAAAISAFPRCEPRCGRNGAVDLSGALAGIIQTVLGQRWMKSEDLWKKLE
ncbi:uncharacterized protein LOC102912131 [Peromyscus maniculatus bairdii]|uniref:uncharacterized protein LOC102912131 n=1 Tax=Peromyscus maniculatus bairdii TaxID=230844 RepID=UPI003FD37CFB